MISIALVRDWNKFNFRVSPVEESSEVINNIYVHKKYTVDLLTVQIMLEDLFTTYFITIR